MMKKIFITLTLGLATSAYSQVIIGDNVGTAPANNKISVLLEFANTNDKGIVLPTVRTKPTNPTEGTIILDASNSATSARIKYYNGISGDGWVDLSGKDGEVTNFLSSQPTTSQVTEEISSKAIIGATSSNADGVLVLESPDKAMVLPIVSDVNNIPSPSPGMMVYVNKTGAKRLAVFNGSVWSFWKP